MSAYKAVSRSFNRQMETGLRIPRNLIVIVIITWKSLCTYKSEVIIKELGQVKSGVTIFRFFFSLPSPPPPFIFPRTLLWQDFPPLVGNDCDRNSGYTVMDRYIRHEDLREELEAPRYIANTRSHDGTPLPGKTWLDRTCNSLSSSLSFFLYLFLFLKKEGRTVCRWIWHVEMDGAVSRVINFTPWCNLPVGESEEKIMSR